MIGHNGAPMDDGWIKKHRSVRTHWLVGHGLHVKPADPSRSQCHTKGEAWEDLIMECRYEDGHVNNGGHKMELRRGELVGAVSWLAHRWNWTPKTVRGFLDALENDGMIFLVRPQSKKGAQKGRQSNIISVCKYDTYQGQLEPEGQPEGQTKGDQRATRGRPEGDIYKDKKGRKEEYTPPTPLGGAALVDQAFEDFWTAFPSGRKQDKGGARDAFRKIVTGKHRRGLRAKAADLIEAAGRYAAAKPDPEYVPMPTTWLNGGRWEDDAASAEPALEPVDGKSWGWWRGKEGTYREISVERWRAAIEQNKPNGTWPWWKLGAPPGHAECLVPRVLIDEFDYENIYRGRVKHD